MISVQLGESSFLHPARQMQWYEPIRFTHDDEDRTGHESGASVHSSTSTRVKKFYFNKILENEDVNFDIYRLIEQA